MKYFSTGLTRVRNSAIFNEVSTMYDNDDLMVEKVVEVLGGDPVFEEPEPEPEYAPSVETDEEKAAREARDEEKHTAWETAVKEKKEAVEKDKEDKKKRREDKERKGNIDRHFPEGGRFPEQEPPAVDNTLPEPPDPNRPDNTLPGGGRPKPDQGLPEGAPSRPVRPNQDLPEKPKPEPKKK